MKVEVNEKNGRTLYVVSSAYTVLRRTYKLAVFIREFVLLLRLLFYPNSVVIPLVSQSHTERLHF